MTAPLKRRSTLSSTTIRIYRRQRYFPLSSLSFFTYLSVYHRLRHLPQYFIHYHSCFKAIPFSFFLTFLQGGTDENPIARHEATNRGGGYHGPFFPPWSRIFPVFPSNHERTKGGDRNSGVLISKQLQQAAQYAERSHFRTL